MEIKMKPLSSYDYEGKTVLLRLDINSPIDENKKIKNENRIKKSIPTVKYLMDNGAKLAIIAHQGDTLDYQNLIPLKEHAEKLSALLSKEVSYIDDVCGPAAVSAVKSLRKGEAIILGNLRYLSEEISTFETVVKLTPQEMLNTYLVRSLAPVCDFYVNDAFAAAHRSCPSMVAFQEILPTAAGTLLFDEYKALCEVRDGADKPCVFVLGGAKISDAFGMMERVLSNGSADKILVSGVTGMIFHLAAGNKIGNAYENWLSERKLLDFVPEAKKYLSEYNGKIEMPVDYAIEKDGQRAEVMASELPMDEAMFLDIGEKTIANYREIIMGAATIFVNGPAGVYENPLFEKGTKELWNAIGDSKGYSVIGGGDTVTAAAKFIDLSKINYVCTAGGAMVQFLSGKELPLVEAMEGAYSREIPQFSADDEKIKEIEIFATNIRINTMKLFEKRGFGHVGGALSVVDAIAVLYDGILNVDPKNPKMEGRDMVVMSKGHAGPALYAALAMKGFFPMSELETLNVPNTNLPSHCDKNKTVGIDATTGSLGQGSSQAVGIALGQRLNGQNAYTYLFVGDGECNEGQVWEAAMFAGQNKLSNLIVFVDNNGKQLDGYNKEIIDMGDFAQKFNDFGFYAQSIDGSSVKEILSAIENAKKQSEKPSCIVLNTVKGQGVKKVEDILYNHHINVDTALAGQSIEELEAHLQRLEGR